MTKQGKLFRTLAVVALLPLGACDLLKVEAPGRIADEDLNNPIAFDGLVAGMQYDLSQGYDASNQDLALFTGELWHGGSYRRTRTSNGPKGTRLAGPPRTASGA
jgi:hypothetical protein